jgi:hypothetical protein
LKMVPTLFGVINFWDMHILLEIQHIFDIYIIPHQKDIVKYGYSLLVSICLSLIFVWSMWDIGLKLHGQLWPLLYPHHKMCGGCYNGFALSCRSVRLHYRVSSINPIPIEGFSSNLAQMFTSTRGMCRTHVDHVSAQGQGHNWRSNIKQSNIIMFCPLCKSYTNWKIFFQSWLKCSPQQGNVQNPCYPFAGLSSRSHLKVKNWLRKNS